MVSRTGLSRALTWGQIVALLGVVGPLFFGVTFHTTSSISEELLMTRKYTLDKLHSVSSDLSKNLIMEIRRLDAHIGDLSERLAIIETRLEVLKRFDTMFDDRLNPFPNNKGAH